MLSGVPDIKLPTAQKEEAPRCSIPLPLPVTVQPLPLHCYSRPLSLSSFCSDSHLPVTVQRQNHPARGSVSCTYTLSLNWLSASPRGPALAHLCPSGSAGQHRCEQHCSRPKAPLTNTLSASQPALRSSVPDRQESRATATRYSNIFDTYIF